MSRETASRRLVLSFVRLARRLFYNTPVHRSRTANLVYERLIHSVIRRDSLVDVRYGQFCFKVPGRDITILPSLMDGLYEAYEIQLLAELLHSGMTFIDVGANIGIHAAVAASSVGPSGIVYCFEPEPSNCRLLEENLRANGLSNFVIVNAAVGDASGTATLFLESNSIGTHSLIDRKRTTKQSAGQVDVQVVTLDDYFADATPKQVRALKIDVEGYEPFVLRGASRTLKATEYLFLEYNRKDIANTFGTAAFLALLADWSFVYRIDEKQRTLIRLGHDELYSCSYTNLVCSRSPLYAGGEENKSG